MFSAFLYGLGQCLVTAAVATFVVVKVTDACQAARDIRSMLWWDKQLREIDAFKEMEVR